MSLPSATVPLCLSVPLTHITSRRAVAKPSQLSLGLGRPSSTSLQTARRPPRWLSHVIPYSTNRTLFCIFPAPALPESRQSSRYQSQHDEHCPSFALCLLSYLFLGLRLPLPTFSPSSSPCRLKFCICPVSTEY